MLLIISTKRREDMGKQDPDLLAKHFESKKPKSTKNKKEGNSSMKKTIITIVVSVVVTLAIVGAFVATFFAGVNHEAKKQADIKARIESAIVTKPESK